jgi:hypothetical protein
MSSNNLLAPQTVVVAVESVRIRTGDLIRDTRLRVVGPVTSAAVAVVVGATVIHEARRVTGCASAAATSTPTRRWLVAVARDTQDGMELDPVRRDPGLPVLLVPEPDIGDRYGSGELQL